MPWLSYYCKLCHPQPVINPPPPDLPTPLPEQLPPDTDCPMEHTVLLGRSDLMVSTHAGCSSSATSVSHSHFLPDCDLIFIFLVSFDDSNFSFYWDQMCSESRLVVSNSLRSHGLCSPWNSPAQNTGVGSLSLLQGTFPTQGLNPGLPHCRWILYQLSHKESPRILEQVAFRFSR